jgi:hypothetical protein
MTTKVRLTEKLILAGYEQLHLHPKVGYTLTEAIDEPGWYACALGAAAAKVLHDRGEPLREMLPDEARDVLGLSDADSGTVTWSFDTGREMLRGAVYTPEQQRLARMAVHVRRHLEEQVGHPL